MKPTILMQPLRYVSSIIMFLLVLLSITCTINLDALAQVKKIPPVTKPAAKAPVKKQVEQIQTTVPVPENNGKDNVAIYPFTSAVGYDYEYAQSVGNAVESGFVRSARFNVVERNRFGSIKAEERFKEVNTSDVVKMAAKFGAKYIITGHITGVNTGPVYSTYDRKLTGYQTSINVAFKIIEVETSLIKASEALSIVGSGGSTPLSKGAAYSTIDGITRRVIASYFPQQFKFMSVGVTEFKKKIETLRTFKIWGGSDNGLKVGDAVEIYQLSYAVNPTTGKRIEERKNIGLATIIEVNSGSTATCEVYKFAKYGTGILSAIAKDPSLVLLEYAGSSKPKGFFDF